MVKKLIKDISEEEFRALNLSVYRHEKVNNTLKMVEHKINDILDAEIQLCLQYGYENDLVALQLPVTIAIHEENNDEFSGYLDKFMNCYTGLQTFQIGWGIKHLYSSRDYYEAHEDYWRVRKKDTQVIYRVKLSQKWLNEFVLKHKTISEAISENISIEYHYDRDEETGDWVLSHTSRVTKRGSMTIIEPVE